MCTSSAYKVPVTAYENVPIIVPYQSTLSCVHHLNSVLLLLYMKIPQQDHCSLLVYFPPQVLPHDCLPVPTRDRPRRHEEVRQAARLAPGAVRRGHLDVEEAALPNAGDHRAQQAAEGGDGLEGGAAEGLAQDGVLEVLRAQREVATRCVR